MKPGRILLYLLAITLVFSQVCAEVELTAVVHEPSPFDAIMVRGAPIGGFGSDLSGLANDIQEKLEIAKQNAEKDDTNK